MKTLEALVRDSSEAELIWINGYLSGLVADKVRTVGQATNGNGHAAHQDVNGKAAIERKATICYGTETGNAKKLALDLARLCKQSGITVSCKGLDQYRFEDLSKERDFYVVVSTQGEGEPPEPAKAFFKELETANVSLSRMRFGVLALGDTAYPLYCKAGEDLDARLHALGAERVLPLQKCDVDYEADAAAWFNQLIQRYATVPNGSGALSAADAATSIADALAHAPASTLGATAVAPAKAAKHSGKRYYNGTVTTHINLNDRGSRKETWHIEIQTTEPVDYQPGDAIAIVPENRPEVVERILALLQVNADKTVDLGKGEHTVGELLQKQLSVCHLLASTVKKYAQLTGHGIPDTRMDLADLLHIYPLSAPEQLVPMLALLSPIAPRLYSVASSPRVNAHEVHLVVAKHRFLAEDSERFGLCSSFLGDLPRGTAIRFYVHHNRAFKLAPEDKDIIMIGPGTGIAPFRGFLQDRDQSGAGGRNWLFFGEQHFQTDFLYQSELQQYLQTGVLQRLSVAFSRDQVERIYVQHRMKEMGAELFNWLQGGAYLYISGTKDPMSKDVEKALLEVIAEQGAMDATAAAKYLEQCKKEGRYQKDVY